MKQRLPVCDFEWVGEMDQVPCDDYGYILEVDLEYPKELHEVHNDYPLAPERMVPPYLSKYCGNLKNKLNISDVECEKLIPNLMDKNNYIIHHKNLQQCLDLGLKLKKIHRGIRFREAAWMAPYIDFNTEMRKRARNAFEKDLFKLLNNAVFGKSMENIFNYITVKLTADPKQYEKLVANPLYKESRQFDNDLHAVLMKRESVKLNKPIYTGFSVLELSKTLMYDFHYNYIVKKYGGYARLLFTDTDSLCYRVYTKDMYKDMLADRDAHFDTSDYPENHELHSDQNKKVIGMMKDETSGTPIAEFVGLRSKMYSILLPEDEKKRAKGINRAVVEKDISHEDYKNTLFLGRQMNHPVIQFRNMGHQIYTVEGNKVSLSAFDDKRYILENGVDSLAYGHRDIDSTANPMM